MGISANGLRPNYAYLKSEAVYTVSMAIKGR